MAAVERIGEGLARRINRRQILQRSAAIVFGSVMAWSARGFRIPGVLAFHCNHTTSRCSCDVISYCPSCSPSYPSSCGGGNGCTWNYSIWGTACWCTATCCYGSYSGYYECCDCRCDGVTLCQCARFVSTGGC